MTIQEVQLKPPGSNGPVRTALVVGGGGGIGQAVALELAAAGHAIAVADVDTQKAAATATAVSTAGANSIWVEMNVAEPSSVHRGLGEIQQRVGTPSIVVNCAGWVANADFVDSDETYWRRMIDTNLMGAIRVAQMTLPNMTQEGWGRIVNVAGEAGRVGEERNALMAAANGGLIAFGKAIALEVVRSGVTVNTVCPGPTATPMLDQLISNSEDAAEMVGSLTRSVPIGRLAQPQEIAPAIAFLASEGAGYITGQTLSVSGGMTRA